MQLDRAAPLPIFTTAPVPVECAPIEVLSQRLIANLAPKFEHFKVDFMLDAETPAKEMRAEKYAIGVTLREDGLVFGVDRIADSMGAWMFLDLGKAMGRGLIDQYRDELQPANANPNRLVFQFIPARPETTDDGKPAASVAYWAYVRPVRAPSRL